MTRRSMLWLTASSLLMLSRRAIAEALRVPVVVGSCSHRGIINTVRQAQAVSGVDKVHAIVGGFHLVPPQTQAQVVETVALMQAIGPDDIIPGHCTGEAFIAAAQAAMPDKMIRSVVGGSYRFGAA